MGIRVVPKRPILKPIEAPPLEPIKLQQATQNEAQLQFKTATNLDKKLDLNG